MLRWTIIAVVVLALATTLACAALAWAGVVGIPVALAIWFAVQLGIVLAGFVFERVRYKSFDTSEPGPGWEVTLERFIDPATGAHVRVWFNPTTGERRYITGTGV
ncbi:hypothetical protein [Glacieibacterium sp.]|uniref:hypothetical protein n=1 Tax=Glacieibacterium sp. TaxID=2860237 RepID=UPI003AFF6867